MSDSEEQESTAKFDRAELVRGWRAYTAAHPTVVPHLKYAAKTDMGQVRENNEDKFECYDPDEPELLAARGSFFAVADGIGGAQAGQIASEVMLKGVIAAYYDHPSEDVHTALYESIVAVNERIYSLAQMIPERSGMGTTLTAAVFIQQRVVLAQVGDSRGYLIRDGAVRQVTADHSWVEEQVRAGVMTRHAAEMSPFRNVITRSVGASATVYPDFFEEEVQVGDTWVLCSDGLTGYVSDDEIGLIAGSHSPSEAARQFIELANARGGRDNITAFVLSVRGLIPGEPGEIAASSAAREPAESASNGSGAQAAAPDPGEERPRSGWRRLMGR